MGKVRYIFLLSLFTLHFISASAQVGERRSDFSVGVNAGMTMSRIDFTPTIKQKRKNAPTAGVSLRYICEKYFTAICGVQL